MASALVIACGAIANELMAVIRASGWSHVEVQCLPASWHNSPERIAPGVERSILKNQKNYQRILVAYGDCGSGGQLDAMLEQYSVERLPGPHCYSFFAGHDVFTDLAGGELGTFFLTDYLAANFDRLILDELGIKQHPELRDMYFGNYNRVLYLAQTHNERRIAAAEAAAASIGLPVDFHFTGLQRLQNSLEHIRITHV